MSVEATSAVWAHSEQNGNRLVVILAIADFAQKDGRGAFPSVDTLAEKARLSDTMIRTILKELVEASELVIRPGEGPGGVALYDIAPRIMEGETAGPKPKTRPKNGQGKHWQLVEGNTGFPTGNTGLEIRVSQQEIRVSSEGNTGLQNGNTGSPNPSLSVIDPSVKPSRDVEAADAAPPPAKNPPAEPSEKPDPAAKTRTRKTKEPKLPPEDSELYHLLYGVMIKVTHLDPRIDKNGKRLADAVKQLLPIRASPELLEDKYRMDGWWGKEANHWAANKGQLPSPEFITETYGWWDTVEPRTARSNGHGKIDPITAAKLAGRKVEIITGRGHGNRRTG